MRRHLVILSMLTALIAQTQSSFASSGEVSASAVVREMNLARTNPSAYARFVEDMRTHFRGNLLVLPGRTALRTREGVAALDEAIRFLRNARPQPPLTVSPGMCQAAADHCADQASGGRGHDGSDRSSPGDRLSRYGRWTARWGENVSYGKSSAREIVLALIVDDGLKGRKHRKNIFSPDFGYAGAAYGPHARYRSVCSIEFAGGFLERGSTRTETLVARNP